MRPLASSLKAALVRARTNAMARASTTIDALDLLAGLAGTDAGAAALYQVRCDVSRLKLDAPASAAPEETIGPGPLYAADARDLLAHADAAAGSDDAPDVECAHLVAALIQAGGPAAELLFEAGVPRPAPPKPEFRFEIAEGGPPIYEQLVEQITAGIARELLAPGERLPSVRGLAAALGIAPGTVARVYAALEHAGLLVTQGAKGTRVAESGPRRPDGAELEALAEELRSAVLLGFRIGATERQVRAAFDAALAEVQLPE